MFQGTRDSKSNDAISSSKLNTISVDRFARLKGCSDSH